MRWAESFTPSSWCCGERKVQPCVCWNTPDMALWRFFCHLKSLNHVLKKRSKVISAIGQKRILCKDLVETWNWRILYIFCIQIYVFITPFVRRSWKNTTRTVPRPHKLQDKNSWGPTETRQTPTELWFLCGWGWPPGTPQTWESTWGTRSPGCRWFFNMC